MRIPFRKTFTASANFTQSTLNDIEKNGGTQANNPVPIEKPPKLLKFQVLTGICSPSLLRSDPTAFRPAPNQGIYQRTIDEESKVKFQYDISKYIVNSGGMLQIVVGAALTALGAASGPSAVVTILGAFNTVIAGMLTYLKGQGLPTRLEQYLHLLRTLREHIEERERELLEPDCPLDVDEEIQRIARMYQEVRQTAEDNAPGTVLPPRGIITSLLKKPDINRSDVPAPRGDKNPTAMLASGLQDLASFGHHAAHDGQTAMKGQLAKEEAAIETTVEKERQHLGAEIQHLGDMAKEALHLGKKAD
ncbi:MAG: hypothetical protein L6R41_004383 [Letrouitia leprolyta]|nr:MAG: hypothetical protein L6R41_004383 [Letrouitia leprolyta]